MSDFLPHGRRPSNRSGAASASHPVTLRIAIAGVVGVALFGILLLRLWALTVLNGSEYAQLAEQNQLRRIPVQAPRGAIVDRNGDPLVTNRASRQVVLNVQDVDPARLPSVVQSLSVALGEKPRKIRERIERGRLRDPLSPVVVADDVKDDMVIWYLEEHADEFPGVDVRDAYVRNYVGGSVAAHMLGQVGEVSPEQLETVYEGLKPGDIVGLSGLERTYDEYLRGTDGYRAVEVDATGVRKGDGRGVTPVRGRNLRLSVDLGLQKATEKALVEGITIARKSGESVGDGAYAAAAVAMDPRSGDVLALASHPTYDPNIFVEANRSRDVTAALQDERTPLTNRATSGLYPPGSIYKVVTGAAAMQEGLVTADTPISCPGYMVIAGKRFNNWTQVFQGSMDLRQALENSCDTYFYWLALRFYNLPGSKMQEWSSRFGLGAETGIDVPGEEEGLIPTPEWRKRTFQGWERSWTPGHSVNLSIGQGDLLVTPVQMARIYAAVANGGRLVVPRLAAGVDEPSGRRVLELPRPEAPQIPVPPDQMKAIHDGLVLVNSGSMGTGTAVFGTFQVRTAGKTGTAEKPPYGDMAWYCGYAPADKPTIAACAIVENGGHGGTSAAPIVLRMFQQWFDASGGNIASGAVTE